MLLTILFIVLTTIGTICYINFFKDDSNEDFYIEKSLADDNPIIAIFGAIFIIVGSCGLIISLVIISIVQIPKEINYEICLNEKQILEYRLENQKENVFENPLLYGEIINFNNKLTRHKVCCSDLWLSWFGNEKIADIEYIKLEVEEDEM